MRKIVLSLVCIITTLSIYVISSTRMSVTATGSTYYVSKNGNNTTGSSWSNAWNELDQINWSSIQAGDTIYIDGGSTSMTYTSTLTPTASGSSGSPITIKLAIDAGH